jgi:RNA polymerase sigma-70 factor (sigma-E family)
MRTAILASVTQRQPPLDSTFRLNLPPPKVRLDGKGPTERLGVTDEENFRDFVGARAPALSRAAYLLTGDHHLAQDLVQSALAATYQHWSRVQAGNPEAYVRRAMHHAHVSWWRKRRPPEVAASAEATGGDEAEATTLRLTVVAALRVLAPRQRAVIVLRYFEDLTEAQTAAALGCSVGTVKRLHFDALARLRSLAPHLLTEGVPLR